MEITKGERSGNPRCFARLTRLCMASNEGALMLSSRVYLGAPFDVTQESWLGRERGIHEMDCVMRETTSYDWPTEIEAGRSEVGKGGKP